jgi:hypothetical protein
MPHKPPRCYAASARMPADERALQLILFMLCLSPIAAAALLSTDGTFCTLHFFGFSLPLHSVCFFKLVTGYRCPVCGMTRCFIYMSHGNVAAAWHISHAGVPLFLLCIYETIYRLLILIFGRLSLHRLFKTIEIVFIILACAAVTFFFAVQFVNPTLAVLYTDFSM